MTIINYCDACVCVGANTSGNTSDSMMLLGGGVFIDGFQIFCSTHPVGTSLSSWRGRSRHWSHRRGSWTFTWKFGFLLGNLRQKLAFLFFLVRSLIAGALLSALKFV